MFQESLNGSWVNKCLVETVTVTTYFSGLLSLRYDVCVMGEGDAAPRSAVFIELT